MGDKYFMIDFENVQPEALDRLQPGTSKVKVFLGQNQSKLVLSLVQALQPFGSDAQYIQIQGSGPDAVDFHIAFYIGLLSSAHPDATFNIISKDKGFDPLVRHLGTLGVACNRYPEIPSSAKSSTDAVIVTRDRTVAAPIPKPPAVAKTVVAAPSKKVQPAKKSAAPAKKVAVPSTAATAKKAIEHLKNTSTRPAKLKSLRSMLQSWFKPQLDAKATEAVVQSLRDSKKIIVDGTSVRYTLT